MRFKSLHDWNLTPAEARALQFELAARVEATTPLQSWRTVAAADVSYLRGDSDLYAAVVVVNADTLEPIETVGVAAPVSFPYVPGLLSFREAPSVLEAFAMLKSTPDVVLCDGQGIAHLRRLGLASHLGLWLDIPTIGCAKSRLCGSHKEPSAKRAAASKLMDGNEVIGAVLRTRDRIKPLYVSVGHLCDLASAIDVVLATATRTRLPVPARLAHQHVNALRQAARSAAIEA